MADLPDSGREVIGLVASAFTELPGTDGTPPAEVDGPIGWPGYHAACDRARQRTGERESVVAGTGVIDGTEAVLIAFDFGFLGGSIGRRTGDRIEAAFACARRTGLPVVSLIATGGSRMQEGMRALTQLQRIARQAALTRGEGLPQVAVLRNPTTGGGWATLGAGADVALAVGGAQVGFAGSRVRPPGDAGAYTAEGQFAAGHVDQIVEPQLLRERLGRWLRLLTAPSAEPPPPPRALAAQVASVEPPTTGWDAVLRARSADRPAARSYVEDYFDWREDIRGDRSGGVDDGVLCGFGHRDGATVAYAAQCGTATTPAGFRTAARLVRLADRLGIPVLTLVDTPGAANDSEAERAGAGPAIAELFTAVASATVPVTTLVIGEGGSGGALAFAAADRMWITPDAYFSVTSPEAAARILKRDADDVPETADQLRLRPQDLVDLGIARGIVD
ncbi:MULTISPECIES: carboxyl transferase domain-containing protein [Prauserella salsuginis group]|uniref:Acetyl-coenzyme A carboxylase carboxyl transferase subunits beta/alpha n=1 Tax=Prauserella salsuginis TaxID=387889 RepID=A0ABW6G2L6_9PSEU|nr:MULTISPECIES: carboxyl transferase domain-containing protein [Prauserella salsuginis group]MCR3719784.1 acetyl-CoA carboxylase carboxyl transferase subunit beta [Prauserella flava]MCR3736673.1 acetyl-CoA carboxylase carboxyl transferase subunit beta [Prauserella salsuginis]